MSLLLNAYHVTEGEIAAAKQAVGDLRLAEQSALRQIAGTLQGLLDGAFPAQQSQRRFDALLVQLGQRLREYCPDLADADDEDAWVRLAAAYAFAPKGKRDE